MNLIIDVGNTRAKVAVFQENAVSEGWSVSKDQLKVKMEGIFNSYPNLSGIIISKVAEADVLIPSEIKKSIPVLQLDSNTSLPFKNGYSTPKTLGNDRKALIAGAVRNFPGKDVLVIDAGTCITYDFKDKEEQYFGGAISPGIQMRYNALHSFTANLPLIELNQNYQLIGDSTENAINTGVVQGVLKEIDGVITEYIGRFGDIRVVITGGDAQFLSINLKNSIFANSNFLLEGLNYILEFNISQ